MQLYGCKRERSRLESQNDNLFTRACKDKDDYIEFLQNEPVTNATKAEEYIGHLRNEVVVNATKAENFYETSLALMKLMI